VGPALRSYRLGSGPARPVNNARLISARIYRTRLELFEAWHQRHGADVAQAIAALSRLVEGAEGDEAFLRLEAALAQPPPGT
jgi:predicted aminopeptidase